MKLNQINIQTADAIRLHIDDARANAANWLTFNGWISGLKKGKISVNSTWGQANCLIVDRPDVCAALGQDPDHAWGFTLHVLDRLAISPAVSMELVIESDGLNCARISCRGPKNSLPLLPFATRAAIDLTCKLFRDAKGCDVQHSEAIQFLPYGSIAPKELTFDFDNTRIGNYHPDILEILNRPDAIGLDIGCGLRDVVYDNMVTQDIYPTPTATLITRPQDLHLPFDDNVFDLIVLDSVLEHVPDPAVFLMEAHRLLKPGGSVYGDVPFLQPIHLAPHHYYNFTPYGLEQTALASGFQLEYVSAEDHQRPEFSLEWLLRRTFDYLPPEAAKRISSMTVGEFLLALQQNKKLIPYPKAACTELAAGFRFHMKKENSHLQPPQD